MINIAYFIIFIYILYTIIEFYKFCGFSFFVDTYYSYFFNSIAFIATISSLIKIYYFNLPDFIIIIPALILLIFNLYKLFYLSFFSRAIYNIKTEEVLIKNIEKGSLMKLFSFFSFNSKIIKMKTPYLNPYIEHNYGSYKIITNLYYNRNDGFFKNENTIKISNFNETINILKTIKIKKLNFIALVDKENKNIFFMDENDFKLLNINSFDDLSTNSIKLLNIIDI